MDVRRGVAALRAAVALEPVVAHGLSSRAALHPDSLDLATACPSVCVTVILPEEDARGLCSPQNLRPNHPGDDGPELGNRERLRQDLHPGLVEERRGGPGRAPGPSQTPRA